MANALNFTAESYNESIGTILRTTEALVNGIQANHQTVVDLNDNNGYVNSFIDASEEYGKSVNQFLGGMDDVLKELNGLSNVAEFLQTKATVGELETGDTSIDVTAINAEDIMM